MRRRHSVTNDNHYRSADDRSVTSTAPITTTAKSDAPQYGGTFTGVLSSDFRTFDIISDLGAGATRNLTNERLVDGDWTKGPAGGYGTSETFWDGDIQIPSLQDRRLAEDFKWTVDADKKTVTVTIKVRQGIHWALNPNSAASRLVNGREVTADDILYNLNERMNNPKSMCYQFTVVIQGRSRHQDRSLGHHSHDPLARRIQGSAEHDQRRPDLSQGGRR